jgi:AcrR family transcriptional regulator
LGVLEWVKPPRQARSAQTLERILEAAEELIAERGLEGTTVVEIARRAGSSVGSFYARFPDKEALLLSVLERFYEQSVATAKQVLDPERWQGVTLQDALRPAFLFLLHVFRERRGLITTFTLRAAREGDVAALGERLGQIVAAQVYELLQVRREQVSHPDPREAVRFATWMVLSALEARALHTTEAQSQIPEELIASELTRMCTAYLGIETEG